MNLAGRASPSGPKVELQLPFYGAIGINGGGGVFDVALAIATSDGPNVEAALAFYVPQRGTLGTLLIANVVLGDDAVNISWQARRNGVDVGSPVIIGNTASGPVRVDLSRIGVSAGDLISLQATVPAFGGAIPVPKIVFTWFPAPG